MWRVCALVVENILVGGDVVSKSMGGCKEEGGKNEVEVVGVGEEGVKPRLVGLRGEKSGFG